MKRKLLILALVVGMMGALLATAGVATGTNGDGPHYVDRGVLLLHTGDDGFRVDWYDAPVPFPLPEDYPATASQELGPDPKCNVTLGSPQLLSIVPSDGNGKVGGVTHGLGVKTKNNCSTSQGLIEESQTLTFSPGQFFDDMGAFVFKSAELDVEGKRNAALQVTYDGVPTDTAEPLPGTSSDNGPDSGIGDNNIVVLMPLTAAEPPEPPTPAYFNSVEFAPVATGTNSPAVAIEGGGDGEIPGGDLRSETKLDTNASVFDLYQVFDGILDCGFETFQANPLKPAEMDGIFKRLENVSGTCTPKPYNLNVTTEQTESASILNFEPQGDQDAAYSGIVSSPEKPNFIQGTGPANPTLSKLEFDPGNGTFYVMQWCTDADIVGEHVEAFTLPSGFMYPEGTGDRPDPGEEWCIAAEFTENTGGGTIRTKWTIAGLGDPRMRGG